MADKNKAKFMPSFFHVGPEQIEAAKKLTEADFQLADEEEKESVIQRRKSVSYWRDAFRRFRENTVSMVALFVFFIIVLFTFVGPMLIPYDYSSQYRTSAKLSPMDNSEDEKAVDGLLKSGVDAVYATLLQPGSLTALRAGDYYFNFKGETYSFSLDKNLAKASIVVDLDQPEVLSILTDKNLKAGTYTKTKPLAYTTGAPSETANEINVVKKIFPHVFGTDTAGRDIMARTMYGGRVSLTVGITAALIVLVIGATYGSISGLAGGKVDFVMMRIVDVIYSVPDVLIVLLLQVVLKNPLQAWFDSSTSPFVQRLGDLGGGIISIFITFALLYWVGMARIVRGQVLQLKEQEFITAATAIGVSNARIIKRHLLPNSIGQIVVATALQIPSAIFLESFLSFLGLGVSAPMASLGSMCSDGLDTITIYPYRLMAPAIILTVLVLSLNLVGDGLRDALDPRLKQ
jgi:oligopeptide transport system permease protein